MGSSLSTSIDRQMFPDIIPPSDTRTLALQYGSGKQVILFSPGNCEEVSAETLDAIAEGYGGNCTVVSHNYGRRTRESAVSACLDTFKYIRFHLRVRLRRVIVVGHSMGSGVCVETMYRHKIRPLRIILIAPYKSPVSVVYDHNPFILWSARAAGVDTFITESHIGVFQCPIDIWHGDADSVISISHSEALLKACARGWGRLIRVPGAGHMDIRDWYKIFTAVPRRHV